MIKLSILILTHKRPTLFKRCIESVLNILYDGIEIIVNNDSLDIEEIPHQNITYYYNKFEHLSQTYEFLLKTAKGEYVYFLEDDDYLNTNFFDILSLLGTVDIIFGNYYPTWNTKYVLECSRIFNTDSTTAESFVLKRKNFQLGQCIFRRSLGISYDFPFDSHIHNDYKLISHVLSLSNEIKSTSKILYFQTTDGGDNISFPESNNYYGV